MLVVSAWGWDFKFMELGMQQFLQFLLPFLICGKVDFPIHLSTNTILLNIYKKVSKKKTKEKMI